MLETLALTKNNKQAAIAHIVMGLDPLSKDVIRVITLE